MKNRSNNNNKKQIICIYAAHTHSAIAIVNVMQNQKSDRINDSQSLIIQCAIQ